MPTVNTNYTVQQLGSFHTGDRWGEREYDWYEWRDYQKDNIDGGRYQLWEKSDPGDWRRNGAYKPDEIVADLEELRTEYKAAENRRDAAERREREREQEARRAAREAREGNGNGRRNVDMSVLLGRLNQLR